jgi:hypothetical protein
MADFNKPDNTSSHVVLWGWVRDMVASCAAILDSRRSADTNVPLYAKRWNNATRRFQEFNGSVWTDITILGSSIDQATTTVRGTVQLATNAEVTAGANTEKVVVPSSLKVELDKKAALAGSASQVFNAANAATGTHVVNRDTGDTRYALKNGAANQLFAVNSNTTTQPEMALNGNTRMVTGNWNSYIHSGFYEGFDLTNTPLAGWVRVIVIQNNGAPSTNCQQIATHFTSNRMFIRRLDNGVWSAWSEVFTGNSELVLNGQNLRVVGSQVIALSSGNNNNVVVNASAAEITFAATGPNPVVTGISSTSGEGRVLQIFNDSAYGIQFINLSSNSSSDNRFSLGEASSFTLRPGMTARFIRRGTFWYVCETSDVHTLSDNYWYGRNRFYTTFESQMGLVTLDGGTATLTATSPSMEISAASSATNIAGLSLSAGTILDGTCVWLINNSSANMTLLHESVNATELNRFKLVGGTSKVIAPNRMVQCLYSANIRWHVNIV